MSLNESSTSGSSASTTSPFALHRLTTVLLFSRGPINYYWSVSSNISDFNFFDIYCSAFNFCTSASLFVWSLISNYWIIGFNSFESCCSAFNFCTIHTDKSFTYRTLTAMPLISSKDPATSSWLVAPISLTVTVLSLIATRSVNVGW